MEPGIYLEVVPPTSLSRAPISNLKHSYLVYRKPDGTTEVIRGGLNKLTGRLSVETGKSLEESADRLAEGEVPGTRPSQKLDVPIEKAETTWTRMRDKAEEIREASFEYKVRVKEGQIDQTSNSLIGSVLKDAKFDIEKTLPIGISRREVPGIDNDLSGDPRPPLQMPNDPNPIEGEIGGAPGAEGSSQSGTDDARDGSQAGGDDTEDDASGQRPPADPGESGQPESERHDPDDRRFSPQQKKLVEDLTKTDRPLDDILAKRPGDLTKDELRQVMKARIALPSGPERDELFRFEQAVFEDIFGTEPVRHDATGRMIEPEPGRPFAKHPAPAKTPNGMPLGKALDKFARALARRAGGDGVAAATKDLQSGLNLLNQFGARPEAGKRLFADLKTDGVVGRKTRGALRTAAARLGTGRLEEGLALGRFNRFARDAFAGRPVDNLGRATTDAFGPLFRDPAKAHAVRSPIEAVTLQETLNDLGKIAFGDSKFERLELDGRVGPKTQDAFKRVNTALGPEGLSRRFGTFLGFFD